MASVKNVKISDVGASAAASSSSSSDNDSSPNGFLEKDPVIRGQNWVCVSFLSPDDVVLNRELFNVSKFMEPFANDLKNCIEKMEDKVLSRALAEKYSYLWDAAELQAFFNTFKSQNAVSLENDYIETYGPKTSVRAIKIRGVYDNIEEARERCKELRAFDKGLFNIYVASIGCWCPWSPDPDEIQDSVYMESQLNSLMAKYVENSKLKDKLYHERFLQMTHDAEEDGKLHKPIDSLFEGADIVSESGKVFH